MTFNYQQARDQADEENDFVAVAVGGYLAHHKIQPDKEQATAICRDVLCHFDSRYLPAKEQAELIVKAAGSRSPGRHEIVVAQVITDARAQFRAYSAGVRYV